MFCMARCSLFTVPGRAYHGFMPNAEVSAIVRSNAARMHSLPGRFIRKPARHTATSRACATGSKASRCDSMLKDQARRRAVSEHAAILVGQPTLGRTDTAPAGNDLAFSLHQAGLRGDRPKKGNLELERCLRKALVEHGAD